MTEAVFTLHQVFTNPRDNSIFATAYGEYATVGQAKGEAHKLNLKRWYVTKTVIVARNADTGEG